MLSQDQVTLISNPSSLYNYLTGPPADLLEMFGISASNIVKAVHDVIKL